MNFQDSIDLALQYEQMIEQEDQYIEQLQTCDKIIMDALEIISKKAGLLNLETVKKAAYYLHSIEQELNRDLFHVRLEKSILSNKMRKME